MHSVFVYLREFHILTVVLRLLLAVTAGGAIGYGRSSKQRNAGLRTYILVSIGAALTVLISEYEKQMLTESWAWLAEVTDVKFDGTRYAAQVISGVGFLAAGTILVTGKQEVKGLTTAAGLWASACMGLAVGAGFIECVVVGFALIMVSIRVLPAIESAVRNHSRNMLIYLETENIVQLSSVVNFIKREGIRVFSLEIDKEKPEHMNSISALLDVRLPIQLYHAELIAALSALDGIISIDEV
jgi:putative Mg2+ transporter-C (MgtC) family protein